MWDIFSAIDAVAFDGSCAVEVVEVVESVSGYLYLAEPAKLDSI